LLFAEEEQNTFSTLFIVKVEIKTAWLLRRHEILDYLLLNLKYHLFLMAIKIQENFLVLETIYFYKKICQNDKNFYYCFDEIV